MTVISLRKEGASPSDVAPKSVKVWYPVVRVFHWTIVVASTLNLFILEEGKYWHRITGYVVAAAIGIRLNGVSLARSTRSLATSFRRRVRSWIKSVALSVGTRSAISATVPWHL
jgi:cytochrome b